MTENPDAPRDLDAHKNDERRVSLGLQTIKGVMIGAILAATTLTGRDILRAAWPSKQPRIHPSPSLYRLAEHLDSDASVASQAILGYIGYRGAFRHNQAIDEARCTDSKTSPHNR